MIGAVRREQGFSSGVEHMTWTFEHNQNGVGDPVFNGSEKLGFFSIAEDGSLKIAEVFRLWENLAPNWWQTVTGMAREDYWAKVKYRAVAPYVRVSTLVSGCRPGDIVETELATTAGRRPRKDGAFEYGAVDRFRARRRSDGALLSEVEQAWTWIDANGAAPRVASAPPPGLRCASHDLAAVPELPPAEQAKPAAAFRWTPRETDINRHISVQSYFERGDNALADANHDLQVPKTWEAWFRRECLAGEEMKVLLDAPSEACPVVLLVGKADDRRRTVLRFSHPKT